MEIVQLQTHHLPDLMQLKAAAQWNQTDDDWLRCLRLDARGCIGVRVGDGISASATKISYGERLSWIGMVLTLPEFRGKGFARRLMEHVLGLCKEGAVRLDASDMGKPLYTSLGFVDECLIERWVRQPKAITSPELPPAQVDPALDREVFGADRTQLLAELARYESAGSGGAYAFARPGSNYYYFGPCVAEDPADFEALLNWFLGRHGQHPCCIDLFPHHELAARIARHHAFSPVRRLTRMVLGPRQPELPDERTYAIAGFEFG